MNILVTGANGQLGQCLKEIVDKNGNGERNHTSSDKNYYIFAGKEALNITDSDAVSKFVKDNYINVIVNCAAYTNVNAAQDKENSYIVKSINATGPLNLANAAKLNGAVLIHISTDYVFSNNGHFEPKPLPPYDFTCGENKYSSALAEENFYGYTKLEGEKNIIKSGCKYIILRTSWLYSIYGKNFVKTILEKLVDGGKEVNVVYDQVGSPTNAHDLAEFIYLLIEKNNSENRNLSKTGIYNFCNEGVASWYDIAMKVKEFVDASYLVINSVAPCRSDRFPQPAERPSYSVLDLEKTKNTFDVFKGKYWGKSVLQALTKMYRKESIKNIHKLSDEYRKRLELENTEFDFGHNVNYKKEENV